MMWINELNEFARVSHKIQFPEVADIDPDHEGVATQLEELSEEA
jgi:hypothetical protein